MICFEHIEVARNGRTILRNVSFEARAGEVTAVLGVNGAGKSTLVRLLSGEWRASGGTLHWLGERLDAMSPETMARKRAVVNQHSDFRFDFTVEEVAGMGRYPHRESTAKMNRRLVREALLETGLGGLADRSALRLSGGERRRLLLARALVQLHEAREAGEGLLVLDEPAAHLDLGHQEHLLGCMRACTRRGLTVFTVLHDLNHAARVADRVVLLEQGEVAAVGNPSEVFQSDLLTRVFGVRVEAISRPGHPPHWVPVATRATESERENSIPA